MSTEHQKIRKQTSLSLPRMTMLAFVLVFAAVGSYLLFAGHAATSATQLQLSLNRGLCMDNWMSNTTNNNKIDIYTCNNTMAQEWNFQSVSGGYLLVNGQGTCAEDTGDGVTGTSYVYLVSDACSSTNHAQIWKWNGQQIQNAYNNGCINDPNSSTTAGQQLIVYSCGANQPNAEWYKTAPPAPTVSISAPSSGATVSGSSVSVSGQASVSPGTITKITLSVAGTSLGSCTNATGCSASWDSTSVNNGSYTVLVTATTSGGATGQVTETIQVSNASSPSGSGSSGSGSSTSSGGGSSSNGSSGKSGGGSGSSSTTGSKTSSGSSGSSSTPSTGCTGSVCISNTSPPSGSVTLCDPAADPSCSGNSTTLCTTSDPSCSSSNCTATTNMSDSSATNCPSSSSSNGTDTSTSNDNTSSSGSSGSTNSNSSSLNPNAKKGSTLDVFLLTAFSFIAVAGVVAFMVMRRRQQAAALAATNQVSFFDEYPEFLAQEQSAQMQAQTDQPQTNYNGGDANWPQSQVIYPDTAPAPTDPTEQPSTTPEPPVDDPAMQLDIPNDMFAEGRARLEREEAERQNPPGPQEL